MNRLSLLVLALATCCISDRSVANENGLLDPESTKVLRVPGLSTEDPGAGERVVISPPEYSRSGVFHTLYLPPGWTKSGPKLPIIFEYTGNFFPRAGSTGEPEDARLGYCLSGGNYIWVSLPYLSRDHQDNQVTWWGDVEATVEYAKRNVPRIIEQFNADPHRVFLCGFSRGAIGVNFIGLHDDEIASLWTAFVSHDHFDGVKAWKGTSWGSPLERYQDDASERLRRVGNRPYLVCQNGNGYGTEAFVRSVLPKVKNFTFLTIDANEIFGGFPNEFAKSPHTDAWAIKPSRYRTSAWRWMNQVSTRMNE